MKIFIFTLLNYIIFLSPMSAFAEDIPSGTIAKDKIFYEYAIYLIEPTDKPPLAVAEKLLKGSFKHFTLGKKSDSERSIVSITLNKKIKTEYQPPEIDTLRYSGKGITKEQASQLQTVSSALIIDFFIPLKNRAASLQEASKFMAELAKRTKGVIWDEETRQVFSRKNWITSRVESFENSIPDVSKHITIHAYKNKEGIRAITLGMVKFGLPDVEVSDFSWSKNRSVGNLINLTIQQLYETNKLKEKGLFVLDISKIKHEETRKDTLKSLYENAKTKVEIRLIKGIRDEGDPNNRIIEIIFDNYAGKDKQEKMELMLSNLWGWKDGIVQVKHNKEIEKASKKAKQKLPQIMKKIRDGLAPGEYYMVKAPFKTPDGGNEWMWIEILSWKNDDIIKGLLKNQPFQIPNLKAGSKVSIKTSDVFDYIHRLADGSSEGNKTGALIQKYSR